jgi:hypothetical protein
LCLGLFIPTVAQASPAIIPQEKVQELEKAVNARDVATVRSLLADTADNQGGKELLAEMDDSLAAGVLEYVMQERFGGVDESKVKWLLQNSSIEIADMKFQSEGNELTAVRLSLRISLKEPNAPVQTGEVPAYMSTRDWKLVLPDGFLAGSKRYSKLLTDVLEFRAKLLKRIGKEMADGKFQSRDQVAKAIETDLIGSEPALRFVVETLPAEAAEKSGQALSKAIDEALHRGFVESQKREAFEEFGRALSKAIDEGLRKAFAESRKK